MSSKTPPTLPDVIDELLDGYMPIMYREGRKQAILTAVRQFVVDIIGEDEAPFNMPIGELVSNYSNALRAEQRKQLLTALGEEQNT